MALTHHHNRLIEGRPFSPGQNEGSTPTGRHSYWSVKTRQNHRGILSDALDRIPDRPPGVDSLTSSHRSEGLAHRSKKCGWRQARLTCRPYPAEKAHPFCASPNQRRRVPAAARCFDPARNNDWNLIHSRTPGNRMLWRATKLGPFPLEASTIELRGLNPARRFADIGGFSGIWPTF